MGLFDGKRRGKNKSGLFTTGPRFDYGVHVDEHEAGATVNQQVPPGCITAWGGTKTTVPSGWLFCNGDAISRTEYEALFEAIGTTYGAGDGVATFNIPDLRGRFPLGKSTGGTGSTLGSTGGTLDHDHGSGTIGVSSNSGAHPHDSVTGSSGSAGGHNHGAEAGHTHGAGSLATDATVVTTQRSTGSLDTPAMSHTHNVTGSTASGGSHTHATDGGHTHGGGTYAVASAGSAHQHGSANVSGSTGTANPAWLALNFIIKT